LSAHAQFEEFCVLATSGQLSVAEARALDEHLRECGDCWRFLNDLRLISGTVLPRVLAEPPVGWVIPEGMRDRFFARAASQGIHIHAGPQVLTTVGAPAASAVNEVSETATGLGSNQGEGWMDSIQTGIKFAWSRLVEYRRPVSLAASACAVCFALGAMVRSQDRTAIPVAADRVVKATSSLPPAIAVPAPSTDTQRVVEHALTPDQGSLVQERAQLESELEAVDKEKRETEKTLQEKIVVLESDAARDHEALAQKTAGLNSRVQTLQSQLDALQQTQLQTEAVLAVQEQETHKYSSRAAELEAQLTNLPRVPSINPDEVRNLVAARNLHIIDVYDSDGVGNRQRAFGRVFYVEGRSLVFYAYDLGKAHTEKKITFHVWGAHANDAETTISLGVLHDEDPNEQRWALTFDDPKVLAKINSVFVTIEPGNRDVVLPTGKKVLYAFLGEKANHP